MVDREAAESEPGVPPPGASALRGWLAELLSGRGLSRKQLQVARFLEANVQAGLILTATEVAERTGVNTATVVRFAQALGFTGWPSLQLQMRHEASLHQLPTGLLQSQKSDPSLHPVDASIQRDIRNLNTALETVDRDAVVAIAELIARSRRTLVVSGGSFSAVGQILVFNGSAMGFPITLENRGGADLMAALGGLDERDCVIGITFWRLARHVVLALESATRRDIPTAAITDSALSPLSDISSHRLVVPSEGVEFFQSLTAAVSVTYALLAALKSTGGELVDKRIRGLEDLYFELDILYE